MRFHDITEALLEFEFELRTSVRAFMKTAAGRCDWRIHNCDGMSEDFKKFLFNEYGMESKIIQGNGLTNGLDVGHTWEGFDVPNPKFFAHWAVLVGDTVVDLTGGQFGRRYRKLTYPLSVFKKNWNQVKIVGKAGY